MSWPAIRARLVRARLVQARGVRGSRMTVVRIPALPRQPGRRSGAAGQAMPDGREVESGEDADRTAAAQAAAVQAEAAYAAMARAAAAAVPGTGEPRVDAALQLLERLPGLPVSDHPELFEQVHAQLSEVLGELESGPRGPAGG